MHRDLISLSLRLDILRAKNLITRSDRLAISFDLDVASSLDRDHLDIGDEELAAAVKRVAAQHRQVSRDSPVELQILL